MIMQETALDGSAGFRLARFALDAVQKPLQVSTEIRFVGQLSSPV